MTATPPRVRRPLGMRVVSLVCVAQLCLGTLAGRARAESAPPPGDESPRVQTTTIVVGKSGLDPAISSSVIRALDEGLKNNKRLAFKDLDTRLAEFAQEVPQDEIDQGRALADEGNKAMSALDLPLAVRKLDLAITALGRVLPYIKKQELADAMMALGVAQWMQGSRREGKATFVRLLTWRQDYKFDSERYAPSLLQPFEEARHEVERARRGSVEIQTSPPGAQAYVDGRYLGVTPVSAEGLVVGEHWVTVKLDGYRKSVMAAEVSSREQRTVKVALDRSRKYLLVEQSVAQVAGRMGAEKLDGAANSLREILFADHVVFVRLAAVPGGSIKVETFLYDLRLGKRLNQIHRAVWPGNVEAQLADIATRLYSGVDYTAELVAPAEAPPPAPVGRRKFYKTWWFWTVIGVVAGGAVLTGLLVPRPVNCPKGQCLDLEF